MVFQIYFSLQSLYLCLVIFLRCLFLLIIAILLLKSSKLVIFCLNIISLWTSLTISYRIGLFIFDLCWCNFWNHWFSQYCKEVSLFIFLLRDRCRTLNVHLFDWRIKWFFWWWSLCSFCCWLSHESLSSISLTI